MEEAKIRAIRRYLKKYNIKHIDVQAELVDHFASSLEGIEKERPGIGFKAALMTAHRRFGGREGFDKYLKAAENKVEKKVLKAFGASMLSFLSWPHFLLFLASFAIAFGISHFVPYSEYFILGIAVLFVFELAAIYFRVKESPYFLVERSLAKIGQAVYFFTIMPYWFLIVHRTPLPFWGEVGLITFAILLAYAYWQIPSKLQIQAEDEYPQPGHS